MASRPPESSTPLDNETNGNAANPLRTGVGNHQGMEIGSRSERGPPA